MDISKEELEMFCNLTLKLVELRIKGCPHLAVENTGPDILYRIIIKYYQAKVDIAMNV
jgi:hypothetical protein